MTTMTAIRIIASLNAVLENKDESSAAFESSSSSGGSIGDEGGSEGDGRGSGGVGGMIVSLP